MVTMHQVSLSDISEGDMDVKDRSILQNSFVNSNVASPPDLGTIDLAPASPSPSLDSISSKEDNIGDQDLEPVSSENKEEADQAETDTNRATTTTAVPRWSAEAKKRPSADDNERQLSSPEKRQRVEVQPEAEEDPGEAGDLEDNYQEEAETNGGGNGLDFDPAFSAPSPEIVQPQPVPSKQPEQEQPQVQPEPEQQPEQPPQQEEVVSSSSSTLTRSSLEQALKTIQQRTARVEISARDYNLAEAALLMMYKENGIITMQDVCDGLVDLNQLPVVNGAKADEIQVVKVESTKKEAKKITCHSCDSGFFETEDDFGRHYENNHAGLSLSEGNVFKKKKTIDRNVMPWEDIQKVNWLRRSSRSSEDEDKTGSFKFLCKDCGSVMSTQKEVAEHTLEQNHLNITFQDLDDDPMEVDDGEVKPEAAKAATDDLAKNNYGEGPSHLYNHSQNEIKNNSVKEDEKAKKTHEPTVSKNGPQQKTKLKCHDCKFKTWYQSELEAHKKQCKRA